MDEWGSVDGDINASAIIRDRKEDRKWVRRASLFSGLPFLPCLIWFGMTGSHVALAIVIFSLSGVIQWSTEKALFETHTFALITERRAQLLEQQVQQLQSQSYDLQNGIARLTERLNPVRDYTDDWR